MSEFKNIHDIFEHANLENEDWLQPSDKVLEEIESSIYPTKRLRWIWLLLPFIFLMSGVYFYWMPYIQGNAISNKMEINNEIPSDNQFDPKNDFSSQQITSIGKVNSAQAQGKPTTTSFNKFDNTNKTNDIHPKNIVEEKRSNAQSNLFQKIKEPTEGLLAKEHIIPFSINTDLDTKLVQSDVRKVRSFKSNNPSLSLSDAHENLTVSLHIKENVLTKSNEEENKLSTINKLPLLKHELSSNTQTIRLRGLYPNLLRDSSKDWQYKFSAGFSGWNLRLNDVLTRRLKLSKFKHSTGKGFFASIGVQKKLNSKIFIQGNLQYEQVALQSDHNTIKQYNPENEIEGTNRLNVDIATPLGFTNAELFVKRTNLNINQPTNLEIDLINNHQIFTLDAGVNLSAQFIDFVKLSGKTSFLTGIHQVLLVSNELRFFEISHNGFEPLSKTKPMRQSGINGTRPYFGLGMQLNYQINLSQAIQFQYLFKQDVVPVFQQDAYKSFLNRQQLAISYITQF